MWLYLQNSHGVKWYLHRWAWHWDRQAGFVGERIGQRLFRCHEAGETCLWPKDDNEPWQSLPINASWESKLTVFNPLILAESCAFVFLVQMLKNVKSWDFPAFGVLFKWWMLFSFSAFLSYCASEACPHQKVDFILKGKALLKIKLMLHNYDSIWHNTIFCA